MVENTEQEQELQEQTVGVSPSPSVPSGQETLPDGARSGTDSLAEMRDELKTVVGRSRAQQAKLDKMEAMLERMSREQRPSVGTTPTGPTPDEIYANLLQTRAQWTPDQVAALRAEAQGQYAAYQGQSQMGTLMQQVAELRKEGAVREAYLKYGIDPNDPDLDTSSEQAFNASVAEIRVKKAKAEAAAQVKVIQEAQAKAEVERKKALAESGALDTLSGGERAGSPGNTVDRMFDLSAKFKRGDISLEAYNRGMAELERQA